MVRVEVEAKIVLPSCSMLGRVEDAIQELGAVLINNVVEEDIYYQHPCRDFSSTDEALRLRRTNSGVHELTYKGPKKRQHGLKERPEITLRVTDADTIVELLHMLGFREVALVRKRRRYYRLNDFIVTLDEVNGLGCFVEIEYAGADKDVDQKMEWVMEMLGLKDYPRTVKSYLEMILEKKP